MNVSDMRCFRDVQLEPVGHFDILKVEGDEPVGHFDLLKIKAHERVGHGVFSRCAA